MRKMKKSTKMMISIITLRALVCIIAVAIYAAYTYYSLSVFLHLKDYLIASLIVWLLLILTVGKVYNALFGEIDGVYMSLYEEQKQKEINDMKNAINKRNQQGNPVNEFPDYDSYVPSNEKMRMLMLKEEMKDKEELEKIIEKIKQECSKN